MYCLLVAGYFGRLTAELWRNPAYRDLEDKVRELGEKSKVSDNSEATTRRRVALCCHAAIDALVTLFGAREECTPLDVLLKRDINEDLLAKLVRALDQAESHIDVDQAEYRMGDPQAHKDAQQLWSAALKKRRELVRIARAMLHGTSAFLAGDREAARRIGTDFVEFLHENGATKDGLVCWAEALVEVQHDEST